MQSTLFVLAALSGIAAIACDWRVRRPAFYVLKPLTTVLLIAVAVHGALAPGLNREGLLIAGLLLCLVGDIALLGGGNRAFVTGLCAFLIGHVAFVGGFYYAVLDFHWPPAVWLIPVWGVVAGAWLLPRAGRLRVPVIAYGTVLGLMVLAALQRQAFAPAAAQHAILAGAVLFLISDTVLAARKFVWAGALLQPLILSTYWLAIGLIAWSIPLDAAARPEPPNPDGDPVIADRRLDELSGLVAATAHAGYWGHNDGRDRRLFRLGPKGENLGTVQLGVPPLTDWEDLAWAEGADGERLLLIADVGDNYGIRRRLALHAVAEPGPGDDRADARWSLSFELADGARDIEAVAVDPADRRILLLSKRDRPPRLYALDWPAASGHQIATFLTTVNTLPPPTEAELQRDPVYGRYIDWPSAMDIGADGTALMVLTYRGPYTWTRHTGQPWADVLQQPPTPHAFPLLAQAEAACFTADGGISIGSEQLPAVLAHRPSPR